MIGFVLALIGAQSIVRAERLPIKTFTVADGLAHNGINKIVRDSRGFLWFCTADGLSRFDGYSFTNYSTNEGLPHPYVNDFLETSAHEYWLGTNGGLVRFDPRGVPGEGVVNANETSSNSHPMFSVVAPDDSDRRARAVTVVFADHEGSIWCGTMKGLFRLDRIRAGFHLQAVEIGIPRDFPEQALVSDLLEDRQGSLWLAAPSGLYRRWPDGSHSRYTTHDGLPGEHLHDVFIDHEGQLWVASRQNGFFHLGYDETHNPPRVIRTLSSGDGLPTNWIFQLFETSNGRFWVATSAGLAEFFPQGDGRGRYFHNYHERNGISHHDITTLDEDLAGNLWAGSPAGTMKIARNGFTTYDRQDGVDEVNAIFEDSSGGVCARGWVLGDGGFSVFEGAKLDPLQSNLGEHVPRFGRFDSQGFTWLLPQAMKNLGWVGEGLTMRARDGEWWIGTGAGLYRFPAVDDLRKLKTTRPAAIYTTKDGLANQQVFRIFEDSRSNIWISTIGPVNGLAYWDPATGSLRDVAATAGFPAAREDLARAFASDPTGNVWIGFNSGLARYRQGTVSFFTTKEGLPKGGVSQLYLDRSGRLWFASSRSGLVRVDRPDADRPEFVSYTTAQGLSSDITSVITEDHNGNLYVGTGRGLDQMDPASGRIKHFTTADGLISGLMLGAFCDSAGTLWIGTSQGLSRFVPVMEAGTAAPPVLITKLSVAGAQQMVSALGETEMLLPELGSSQNQVQIDFVGLSFASGDVLRYQYKLDGADANWSALADRRTVNYANLAPGHYAFHVRAMNSDNQASVQPAIITFTILPPIWRRWWFLSLMALAILFVIYLIYRYQVARLLEVANVRTRIATDLHDDIGANLTKIAILSEVARQQLKPTEGNGDSPLSAIARISRESVSDMSDIVWAINPARDSLLDLTRRMRQHAGEMFALGDIELVFDAPGAEHSLRLGVDVRRNLYLIFKEAVNNAARHANCSRVEVKLEVEGGQLTLIIADNGRGFDLNVASEGQGLTSMRQRAQSLGGSCEVESGEAGTTVRVKLLSARYGSIASYLKA